VQREVDVESKSAPKRRPLHAPLGGSKSSGAPPVMVFTTKGMVARPGALKAGAPARPSIKEMIKNQQRRASLAVKAEDVAPKKAGSVVAILPSCASPLSVVDI
jgi:hypothetical protein